MTRTTQRPEHPNLSSEETETLALQQAEVMSELWILRDRVTLLEHLLTEAGILEKRQLDQMVPPPELAEKLDAERDAFVARIVGAGHRQSYSVEALRREARSDSTKDDCAG